MPTDPAAPSDPTAAPAETDATAAPAEAPTAPTEAPAAPTDAAKPSDATRVQGPRAALNPAPVAEPEPPKREPRWPPPLRRGGLLIAGVGVAGCGEGACDSIKAAAWLNLAGGYRFGRFAPILQIAGGTTPRQAPDTVASGNIDIEITRARASLGFFYVGAGTLLHLLASTHFDPYVGVTLGYFQTRERLNALGTAEGVDYDMDHIQATHRGAIGIIAGLGFRIVKRFTLGPRFDFLVPFAGRTCARDFGSRSGCADLDSLEADPGEYLPRPWAVTLQAGFVI